MLMNPAPLLPRIISHACANVAVLPFVTGGVVDSEAGQAHPLKPEFQRGYKHAQPVLHAAWKVDRRGFGKVLGGAGDFADSIAEIDGLSQDLVVKQEIVGILFERKLFQDSPREGAISRVILRQLVVEQEILYQRKESVRNVLVQRHPSLQGA